MNDADEEKRLAAAAAVSYVTDGMTVGLGTGSTASYAIALLGKRCQEGLRIRGIPTSTRSAALAWESGIPLVELESSTQIDVTIDGADEFDPHLNLLKGGGGALLREKIVAWCSKKVVIVTDSAKSVPILGRFPLPVEVLPFAARAISSHLAGQYGIKVAQRQNGGEPWITDQGNWILDCRFHEIADPFTLGEELSAIPGLLGHGLFTGMTDILLMARNGEIVRLEGRRAQAD